MLDILARLLDAAQHVEKLELALAAHLPEQLRALRAAPSVHQLAGLPLLLLLLLQLLLLLLLHLSLLQQLLKLVVVLMLLLLLQLLAMIMLLQ